MLKTLLLVVTFVFVSNSLMAAERIPNSWKTEFPLADFSKASISLSEILSGGPPRDGIPAIDDPRFVSIEEADLVGREPVVRLVEGNVAKAYPLRVLIWHEIVNDVIAGRPVTVTYCPLCNAAIVFDRNLDGQVLDFGTTGRLRKSDLVMYDRQTETWWQQFSGEGIIGTLTGKSLKMIPARIESFDLFRAAFPDGKVLQPGEPRRRSYGYNPYEGYDSSARPFLYDGEYDGPVPMMARLVAVGEKAWALEALRQHQEIIDGDLKLSWTSGQASALDSSKISEGRDVGNIVVQRRDTTGEFRDEVHDITFAFVFKAFRPNGIIFAE